MEVKCFFSSIVGGCCSFDPKDSKKSTKVIPFINCNRDIAGYKSFLSLTDVESEIELILSRAAIFSDAELNLLEMMICPHQRSSLGIGWRRGSNKCQVPPPLSKHDEPAKVARAERGLGKTACHLVWKKSGIFIPVGTGKF